jgi:chemotaxis protein methyltransferase CheR
LLRILQLLEERHGVGVRGADLPGWLEQRLSNAVDALSTARGLDRDRLLLALDAEPELIVELANALRVGETRFYRDAAQWEALRLHVIPQLRAGARQSLRALSAGCSTGEEAWTLAMLLASADRAVPCRVLGVDRSVAAIEVARGAVYDLASERHLPREMSQRYMSRGVDGSVQVVPDLRRAVSFQCRDLTQGMPPGRYDLIVCRNVLIYFGDDAQKRLIADLLNALSNDGVLVVARSEVPIVRANSGRAFEMAPGVAAFRA